MLQTTFFNGVINRTVSFFAHSGGRWIPAGETPVARCDTNLEASGPIHGGHRQTNRACAVEHGVWTAFVHLGHGGPVMRP